MKVAVCLKPVPDTETKLEISSDSSCLNESSTKWITNPYDEFALEEAIKLKESFSASVHAFSLGVTERCQKILRTALALGVDEAFSLDTKGLIDSFHTSKFLSDALSSKGPYDIVFFGKTGIDDNQCCIPQMVAEFLKIPHVQGITKFKYERGASTVEKMLSSGVKQTLEVSGPFVFCAEKGLNIPRYPSLPNIMKAKNKPLSNVALGPVSSSELKVTFKNYQMPSERSPVTMLEGSPEEQVKKLIAHLRDDAKVI